MSDPAAAQAAITPDAGPPKGALRIIFFIVMMDLFGFGIIIPLLPFYIPGYSENTLTQTFKVTLLFSVYSICQFIGAPILGLISDRHGRRPVLALSQAGSAVGYVLLALATQFEWRTAATTLTLVYLSRIIDGFTGGNISTAQAYISDVSTPETRSKSMGVLGAAFGIGFVLGPMCGGILGHFSTSLPAYVAAAASAGAAIVTAMRLPESRVHIPVAEEAWLHPSKFAPIFRRSALLQMMCIGVFSMMGFVMMESTSSLFFNTTLGWSKLQIGLYFCYVGVIIVSIQGGLIGRLTKRYGEWPLAIAGPACVMIGMLFYVLGGWHRLASLMFVAGFFNASGRSLQGPSASSLVSKLSDPREQGMVFGFYNGMQSLARVAGPLIAAPAYQHLRHTGQFLVAGGIAAACAVWTIALHRQVAVQGEHQGFVVAGAGAGAGESS